MNLFNTDRIAKDQHIANLLSVNRQLSDELRRMAASSSMGRRRDDVRLIDMKAMNLKKFDGTLEAKTPQALRSTTSC